MSKLKMRQYSDGRTVELPKCTLADLVGHLIREGVLIHDGFGRYTAVQRLARVIELIRIKLGQSLCSNSNHTTYKFIYTNVPVAEASQVIHRFVYTNVHLLIDCSGMGRYYECKDSAMNERCLQYI